MSLSISQNYSAVIPGVSFVEFLATGGTPPYVYSVLPSGAGGTIDPSSGAYTAPSAMTAFPATSMVDTIQVTDSTSAVVSSSILIGSPLFLVCDIIQKYMGLDSNHIYLWDQKVFQPTDSGLYVAVAVESCKPFGNNLSYDSSGNSVQSVNMYALLGLNIISRGPAARDLKEMVLLSLNSTYAEQQMEANSFYVGKLSTSFTNLSNIDGAAIPYRFHINVALQYVVTNTIPSTYFDTFTNPVVDTNP